MKVCNVKVRGMAGWCGLVAIVAATTLVQCAGTGYDDDSGDDTPDTCLDLAYFFGSRASNALAGFTDCESDEDCILVVPQIDCDDREVHLIECAVSVNSTSGDAYLAAVAALETEVCVGPITDCTATPGCPELVARCRPGGCEIEPQTP